MTLQNIDGILLHKFELSIDEKFMRQLFESITQS